MLTFALESPLNPDLALLMERHHADMHADTPPGSNHMLDPKGLTAPSIRFFVLREDGRPIGMGALKRLDPSHAEIKSMHILAEERGRGLARLMLDHLLAEAAADGIAQVSLETGAQPSFAAARGLYERGGFAVCPPFGSYAEDPNSTFMTRML
ncbi:GNAT family N-acetyltransferase [Falsirhodobacter algicola]|uniref:GNAT family N-acetyltransferase n=2 Tax=Falsirhodobacter algicola TaxID=2692330 RepID=A0A8J8SLR9_9RHOB|nr:GNAT family N-acetyltransferase [Falsirhodobacter algicola]